jgi:hypothetical protein
VIHRGAIALVVCLLLGACGGTEASTLAVAGVAEMLGPYQAEPFRAFDPALVTLLRDTCLHDFAGEMRLSEGLEAALVDGRGGGRFMLLMEAPDGRMECVGSFDAGGTPSTEGGSSSSGGGGVAIGPRELVPGGSGSGSWSYVTGHVGSEIGGVVLELADGSQITASVGGGMYAAWWPGEQQAARILAYDRNGALVPDTPIAP